MTTGSRTMLHLFRGGPCIILSRKVARRHLRHSDGRRNRMYSITPRLPSVSRPDCLVYVIYGLVALCLVSLAAGCAPKNLPPEPGHELPNPAEIVERFSGKHLVGMDLKGLARVTLRSPQGTFASTCLIAARLPFYLRVETFPPIIGPPNLFFSLNGKGIKVYVPDQGTFYIGGATKENITRFLPFCLEVEEMIPLMMGVLPPSFRQERTALKGVTADGLYRIDAGKYGGETQSCFVDLARGELVRVESKDSGGRLIHTANLRNYRPVEGMTLPQDVELRYEEGDLKEWSLRVSFSDIRLSRGEDNDLYDLEIPSGVDLLYLD